VSRQNLELLKSRADAGCGEAPPAAGHHDPALVQALLECHAQVDLPGPNGARDGH
jgi:hypothetical protein